ncbi:MAG: nuclear transport factor 2 family protein [Jatrophihabitantaceae bacterium]
MARSAEAVVRAHLDAFNRGDVAALLHTLTPDAFFMTATRQVDPAEFPSFFGDAIAAFAPHLTYGPLLTSGDEVACQLLEEVTIDGRRREYPKAAFYRVTDGGITWAKIYWEGAN